MTAGLCETWRSRYSRGRLSLHCARFESIPPVVGSNLSRDYFEDATRQAGLRCCSVERIGSELIEYYEESEGRVSCELMRIARMRRGASRFQGVRYESAAAVYTWMVYLLLGKLEGVVITLQKCGD